MFNFESTVPDLNEIADKVMHSSNDWNRYWYEYFKKSLECAKQTIDELEHQRNQLLEFLVTTKTMEPTKFIIEREKFDNLLKDYHYSL